MEQEEAERIWDHFMGSPDMLIQPRGNERLRPSTRADGFLGSTETYKKKFLKAMEKYKQ